jgi:Cu/Ag efflux pump CusA
VLGILLAAGLPQLASGSVLPQLQDRNVLVRLEAAPGTSLAEMDRVTGLAATELRGLDGVESIGTHVGRAVGADEVVDVDASEMWIRIADDADHAGTLAGIRSTVEAYPGLRSQVRSYADDRMSAVGATTGDRLVVRVSGEDYPTLQKTADQVRDALRTVEGVISPQVEPLVSQPTVAVQVDLVAAQREGLRPGDVRREVSALVSGLTVGSLYEQQAIFDVVVRGAPDSRSNVEGLKSLLVHTPNGDPVRLGDVASVEISSTPTVITHDAVSRSLDVTAKVRGRDADEVAAAATDRLRQLTFEDEYRAEVVGDAVERADARQQLVLASIAAALLVFLLLQAATNSWRGAAVLLVAAPLAASGALLAGYALGGARSGPALAAVAAVVVLAVRQSLVLIRRAQALHDTGGQSPATALRAAAEDQAAPVLITALVTAAAFVPAAVMGAAAGLEILQPFSVALIAGLITSVAVVLFLVPALFAAIGGLRPAPVVGPDTPDGTPVPESHGQHERPTEDAATTPAGGTTMRFARPIGTAALALSVGLGLTACQTAASAEDDAGARAATVEADDGGGPARLHLTEEAATRLAVETAAVEGEAGALAVPYAAVVYDADGGTWAFVEVEPRVYQRAPITITSVEGDLVRLSDGPDPGSEVVTVAAAELVGVEAGISGGE